jgi:hypothetical protein
MTWITMAAAGRALDESDRPPVMDWLDIEPVTSLDASAERQAAALAGYALTREAGSVATGSTLGGAE